MGTEYPIFKAAAVQSGSVYKDAPEWFDVKATLDKAISLINEASKSGARLVVFPECFLPGFPFWSIDFTDPRFAPLFSVFLSNSIEVPGPEIEALCKAAKAADTYVATGINERDKQHLGRMYNSVVYISPRGEVMGTHRKICNTVFERLFHTQGDGGENLNMVFSTEIGKLGGLICGEHCQHTLLHNYVIQGMEVCCSLFPGIYFAYNPPITYGLKTGIDVVPRAFCFANTFAVVASTYMSEKDCPKDFYKNSIFNHPEQFFGGSGIINPYSEYVAGPAYDEETIVYGDIDLSMIPEARFSSNLVGNYSRWDILSLGVREKGYEPVFPLGTLDEEVSPESTTDVAELRARIKSLEDELRAAKQAKGKE